MVLSGLGGWCFCVWLVGRGWFWPVDRVGLMGSRSWRARWSVVLVMVVAAGGGVGAGDLFFWW